MNSTSFRGFWKESNLVMLVTSKIACDYYYYPSSEAVLSATFKDPACSSNPRGNGLQYKLRERK